MPKIALILGLFCWMGSLCAADPILKQRQYIAIHQEFRDLQKQAGDTDLVVSPKERAMWLELDGKPIRNESVSLPARMKWAAFRVTHQGISQVSFPLRIDRPRAGVKVETDVEIIYVLGVGSEQAFSMSFAATTGGNSFSAGFCTGIGAMQFTLPRKSAGTPEKASSMLIADDLKNERFRESVTLLDVPIRIIRKDTDVGP